MCNFNVHKTQSQKRMEPFVYAFNHLTHPFHKEINATDGIFWMTLNADIQQILH